MNPSPSDLAGFDGLSGRLSAPLMARMNRDMERAAADEIGMQPGQHILSIGFGPGVGIAMIDQRVPGAVQGGIDPSEQMVLAATRRNRPAIDGNRVVLRRASAEAIPWPDNTFDAVVAVNSIQFWHPLETAVAEVARVLRLNGALVTLTHTWAIEKRSQLDDWVRTLTQTLSAHRFDLVRVETGSFRTGPALILCATAAPA